MSEKLYLIVLNGGGDTDIKLVNKDVWDWINSPYTDDVEKVPDAVVVLDPDQFSAENTREDEDGYCCVCPSSYDNDRAMGAPGLSFWSMKEAMQYIRKHDIEIIDEYEGYLY
jgi:hypothetical protein